MILDIFMRFQKMSKNLEIDNFKIFIYQWDASVPRNLKFNLI